MAERIVGGLNDLIDRAHAAGVPVIFTQVGWASSVAENSAQCCEERCAVGRAVAC